jgi:DNA (cytosine-5)-methyltransferase 1
MNLPTKEAYNIAFHTLPSHCPCYICGLEAMNAEAESVRLLQKGFALLNVTYHINDFVYIQPTPLENSLLLKIGQIVGISGSESDIKIQIRYLGRYTQSRRGKNLMVDEVCQNTKYLITILN